MRLSRDREPCHAEIFRRWQGLVIADGGDGRETLPEPVSLLEEHGFVEQQLPPAYRWFELPPDLSEQEENARASRALAALTGAGYRVAFDADLNFVEDTGK